MVLPQVQEVEYISAPWFKIYGERSGAFVATLVDVVGCGIISTKHGHDVIGVTVSSSDVGTGGQVELKIH
jgi:hypothetical protein